MQIHNAKHQNKSDSFPDKILELAKRVLQIKTRIAKGEELLTQMPDRAHELKLAINSYKQELEELLSDAVELMDELEKILNEKREELRNILHNKNTLIGKALIERALENEKGAEEFEKEANSLSDKIESSEKSIQSLQMLLRDIKEKVKLELRCPKCGSVKISYTSIPQWGEIVVLYRCEKCGHTWRE
ncbi:MAG: hypothetical protein DRJ60_06180 [Thermoprotei archaeon]|nr:MAG: hypothetical protein DRJ60_06180 [Thermoprotei archaeon]